MASNDTNVPGPDTVGAGAPLRPKIGLTTYLQEGAWGVWEEQAAILPKTYLDAVIKAGGTPVLLPPIYGEDGPDVSVLDLLDGLIISGGSDVDPHFYGQEPHERTAAQPTRDVFDMALGTRALQMELPLFAICRGAQIINVACGGTLTQHIPDSLPDARYQPGPGTFGSVDVTTAPDSRARELMGQGMNTRVYHHQGIDRLGEGLSVTARDRFGTVEAIEADTGGWNLGVQFHPEQNAGEHRLFEHFIEAARQWTNHRSGGGDGADGGHRNGESHTNGRKGTSA